MEQITVLQQQSMPDIAIVATGALDALMSIAIANNRSITDVLGTNEQLTIPDDITKDKLVLKQLNQNKLVPATDL